MTPVRCEARTAPGQFTPVQRAARVAAALLALWGLPAMSAPAETPDNQGGLRPFQATFNVNYKGFNAGTTTLQLTRDNQGVFEYQSRATARGIFRIAFSNEISQTSWFVIMDGRVVPVRYRADDGSKKTDRDIEIEFDWDRERARGVAEDERVDIELEPGVQDPMSIQAAHFMDLAAGETTSTYRMVDKDRIKEYFYRPDGTERLATAIGELDTVIYRVERPGSKRVTRTWHAPSLGYLPVRGERLREGKREFVMEIRSLERE